jgi:hypothetical protein
VLPSTKHIGVAGAMPILVPDENPECQLEKQILHHQERTWITSARLDSILILQCFS